MSPTYRLFAMPSWLAGVARCLDLAGTFARHSYRDCGTPAQADFAAIAADWQVVGQDIASAIGCYAAENDVEET